jgi:hypothetical protein
VKRPAGWSRKFAEPVPLPSGGTLRTLADARAYILALPEAEAHSSRWAAATEALLLVVEHKGPTMFARMALMQALNPTSGMFPVYGSRPADDDEPMG